MDKLYLTYHILMGGVITYFFTKTVWNFLNVNDCYWSSIFLMLVMMSVWLHTIVSIKERGEKRCKK